MTQILTPAEINLIVTGIRGAREVIAGFHRKLEQAQNEGRISPEERKRIVAESERTDIAVDEAVQRAMQALEKHDEGEDGGEDAPPTDPPPAQ